MSRKTMYGNAKEHSSINEWNNKRVKEIADFLLEMSQELDYYDRRKIVRYIQTQLLTEGVGRITPYNQTIDVGPNEVTTQAKKFGSTVDKDGRPPILTTDNIMKRKNKKQAQVIEQLQKELKKKGK